MALSGLSSAVLLSIPTASSTKRESAFFSAIANGWPANPTTSNYAATVPFISVGDNVSLASDYTSSGSFLYASFGEPFVAVFLKT